MKPFAALIGVVPFISLTWACGNTTEPPEGGTDAVAETSGIDSSDAAVADVVDGGAWHFIDGGGDCAPTGNGYTFQTCCNGQPCFGNCVEDDVGDVQCNCAGISGGCTGGLVCCTVPAACVSEPKCGLGQ